MVYSLPLAQLSQLPLEARFASILRHGQSDLAATLQGFRNEGILNSKSMNTERLAWAVAFNVDGVHPPQPTLQPGGESRQLCGDSHFHHGLLGVRRGIRGYQDRWPAQTEWSQIWSMLIQPLTCAIPRDSSSLLGELALSVACEQRNEWQNPSTSAIDPADANQAFEFVYTRNNPKVAGHVLKVFGNRAGDSAAITHEAWSRVFCDYWSSQARRRFLGLSRISTLVCQVAYFVASDVVRNKEAVARSEYLDSAVWCRRAIPSMEEFGITIDPERNIMAEELKCRIEGYVGALPAKRRIVAEMVWFCRLPAARVAEILGVSKAAVSQHLEKARAAIRGSLREDGLEVPH
jgi:RNA polymerase sigma factor (sigma-70 family)